MGYVRQSTKTFDEKIKIREQQPFSDLNNYCKNKNINNPTIQITDGRRL